MIWTSDISVCTIIFAWMRRFLIQPCWPHLLSHLLRSQNLANYHPAQTFGRHYESQPSASSSPSLPGRSRTISSLIHRSRPLLLKLDSWWEKRAFLLLMDFLFSLRWNCHSVDGCICQSDFGQFWLWWVLQRIHRNRILRLLQCILILAERSMRRSMGVRCLPELEISRSCIDAWRWRGSFDSRFSLTHLHSRSSLDTVGFHFFVRSLIWHFVDMRCIRIWHLWATSSTGPQIVWTISPDPASSTPASRRCFGQMDAATAMLWYPGWWICNDRGFACRHHTRLWLAYSSQGK